MRQIEPSNWWDLDSENLRFHEELVPAQAPATINCGLRNIDNL